MLGALLLRVVEGDEVRVAFAILLTCSVDSLVDGKVSMMSATVVVVTGLKLLAPSVCVVSVVGEVVSF